MPEPSINLRGPAEVSDHFGFITTSNLFNIQVVVQSIVSIKIFITAALSEFILPAK